MDKKAIERLTLENADVICAKILEESQAEARQLLERSTKQAQQIIAQAQQQAQAQKVAMVKASESQIQKAREKMASVMNLEKKRLILGQKDAFVRRVLERVSEEAASLRSSEQYPSFLERWAAEGIAVIGAESAEIFYSYRDEPIFTDGFVARVRAAVSRTTGKNCQITLRKADFDDLGVIVNSSDGRMLFDNRFQTRLERVREQVTMELLKQL